MCTISLSLAKPGKAIAGAVQQLDGASPACVSERSRTGGPGEETEDNADTALIRLFSFDFKQRHAPQAQRGACDCEESGSVS